MSSETALQPYNEVFSLERFRENELIHGRWAMLAILGALSVEALTGVTWQDAGKVRNYFCTHSFFSTSHRVIHVVCVSAPDMNHFTHRNLL